MIKNLRREIPTIELFYICDDDFHKEVDEVRKKFSIETNKEGIVDILNVLSFDQMLIDDSVIRNKYYSVISGVCRKYHIEDYLNDVEIFVESGLTPYDLTPKGIVKPIPITKPEIRPRDNNIPEIFGCKVEFVVRCAISQKDLNNWFERYREFLLIEINDNFKGSKRSITKLEKLTKILRIIELRDEKKLTFSQIADELCTLYPHDRDAIEGLINEVSVRKIYNRFKKRYKRDTS